jgi:hypothetical protein
MAKRNADRLFEKSFRVTDEVLVEGASGRAQTALEQI